MAKSQPKTNELETVEPIGNRVLIRKDEDKKVTKVGIPSCSITRLSDHAASR